MPSQLKEYLETHGYTNVYANYLPPNIDKRGKSCIAILEYPHGSPFGASGIDYGQEAHKVQIAIRRPGDAEAFSVASEIRDLLNAGMNEERVPLTNDALCRPASIYRAEWDSHECVTYQFNMTVIL